MARRPATRTDYAVDLAVRALLRIALALPYSWRVPFMGWVMARIAAPLAGWNKRVRANLHHVWPDLPSAEIKRLVRGVPDNFGRALIEMYSGDAFKSRMREMPVTGDGLAALERARDAGRPVVLITGHFGSYDAARVALAARGFPVGGVYNPMTNPYFNAHYVAAMAAIGEPIFARGRKGLTQMIGFLRAGGMVGMIADQFMKHGVALDFLGKPALTALSAAEMALKYDALVVPVYGIRQPDGLSFEIRIEAPIPHGDPVAMTQAMNDSLGALVKRHPEQWFWIHRRWKTAPSPKKR